MSVRKSGIWVWRMLLYCTCMAAALGLFKMCAWAAESESDLSVLSPIRWLLKPFEAPASEAKTESDMKSYREVIPGTEVSFEMKPIPGGTFTMGSPPDEEGRAEDEGPQVEVSLEPFWMGKCEVTWDEFELWMIGLDRIDGEVVERDPTEYDLLADGISGATEPYSDMTFGMGRDGYPAVCMTQLAAKMYCKWLSAKTGRFYRLPTEAEWEYACRAGTDTPYSFGKDAAQIEEYAWHEENSFGMYSQVGEKKPNPWGLHDMHGNVAEWVLDRYTPEGYQTWVGKELKNPVNVPEEIYPRVVRGGSFMHGAALLRSAARGKSEPAWKDSDPQIPRSIWYHTEAKFVGFRVVRPLNLPQEDVALKYDIDNKQKHGYLRYPKKAGGMGY